MRVLFALCRAGLKAGEYRTFAFCRAAVTSCWTRFLDSGAPCTALQTKGFKA